MRKCQRSRLLLVSATTALLISYAYRMFGRTRTTQHHLSKQTDRYADGPEPQKAKKLINSDIPINRIAFLADGYPKPSLDRVEYATFGLQSIISGQGLVLEIAPLAAPLLPPDYVGYRSVDVTDREGLLFKYEGHGLDESVIRDPDYIWTGQRYKDLVGENERFELVVASHVLEHVPNLIAFLNDVGDILTDSGELRVIFPDYRYCFDWSRQPTRIADIVAAHIENRTKPAVADVYDEYALVHTGGFKNDPKYHWHTVTSKHNVPDDYWHGVAIRKAEASVNEYVDVHVWRFDPDSFVEYMNFLSSEGLITLKLINVVRAEPNDFHVFATFRKRKV